jgi:hypothetical protein
LCTSGAGTAPCLETVNARSHAQRRLTKHRNEWFEIVQAMELLGSQLAGLYSEALEEYPAGRKAL